MYQDLDFQLFDALRRTGQALRASKPGCGSGASKREIILAILSENEGGMRQNQLASAFRVSPSTLSEMLNRLEADGLIERRNDPADRRATLLTLTDEGGERVDRIRDQARRSFAEIFSALSDSEKRQLIDLLMKISSPES